MVEEKQEAKKSEEKKQVEKKEEPAKEKKVVAGEKDKQTEQKTEKKEEKKEASKKKDKKKEEPKIKKEEAFALGRNLHISKRHGVYVCNFVKDKKIDDAINDLENVKKLKEVVPFKGEIPHKKGKGVMSGRYPVKAAGLFINILKSLKGNVIINGLDLDKSVIYFASANWARRPVRSGRRQGKRTHILLKAREMGEIKR